MEHLYVIESKEGYIIGRHTGDYEKLRSRYLKSHIHFGKDCKLFIEYSDSRTIEKQMHDQLRDKRLLNDRGNKSETFKCSIGHIYSKLKKLLALDIPKVTVEFVNSMVDNFKLLYDIDIHKYDFYRLFYLIRYIGNHYIRTPLTNLSIMDIKDKISSHSKREFSIDEILFALYCSKFNIRKLNQYCVDCTWLFIPEYEIEMLSNEIVQIKL